MNKALLVIDIQNDYFWDKRLKNFTYDTPKVINNINVTINKYKNEGYDIIYISHLIHNFPTNRLLFGYSIKGTEGAELYKDLNIVSDYKFDKYLPSAYTNRKFSKFMKDKNYDTILVCGIDEAGCVLHTSLAAKKRTNDVRIIRDATFSCLGKIKQNKAIDKLLSKGIKYI